MSLLAALALIVYFIWEGAPWHRNRGAESCYLMTCLIMCAIATITAPHPNYDDRVRTCARVSDMLLLIALIQMYVQKVKPALLPPFYHDSDPRPFAKRLPKSKLSRRLVKDLSNQITLLVQAQPLLVWLRASNLPVLVFATVALERLCLCYHDVSSFALVPTAFMTGFLLITWLLQELYNWRKRAPAREMLTALFEAIVDRGEKTLMTEILNNIDVPTLIQCGTEDVQEKLIKGAVAKDLLEPFTKAVLLNGLQKVGLTKHLASAVRLLMLSCKGSELTAVKSALDSTGDYYNLYKLIYVDLREPIRSELISHLEAEAKALRSSDGPVGVKVLSDIDDTLQCSGGHFPAGCDKRLPKKMIYPGFLTLLRELDRSYSPALPSSNVVFLSARPHVYKDISEQKSFRVFRQLFQQSELHTIPSLLPGSFRLGLWAVIKNLFCRPDGWEEVGRHKAKVFMEYARLYGEYDFLFCGDNGQGDLLAGQCMLNMDHDSDEESIEEQKFVQGSMLAVLIHQVQPVERSLSLSGEPSDSLLEHGIFFFETYVGAAVALHKSSPTLMSIFQLARVAQCAQDDFDAARIMYPEWIDNWADFEDALRIDLGNANDLIQMAGLPALRLVQCTELVVQEEPFHKLFCSGSSSEEETLFRQWCASHTHEEERARRFPELWRLLQEDSNSDRESDLVTQTVSAGLSHARNAWPMVPRPGQWAKSAAPLLWGHRAEESPNHLGMTR
ncbi:unnamed protein product [Effrenium voratum]|nr:unnamed protein product [Effrenium voratum]